MKYNLKKRIRFNIKPHITAENAYKFSFACAAVGLTPEKMTESFINSVCAMLSSEDISIDDIYMKMWWNKSWFSQDDGYFSFLQYAVLNNCYDEIINCIIHIQLHRDKESYKNELRNYFEEYCKHNIAHKSFQEEMQIIISFEDKLCRGILRKTRMPIRKNGEELYYGKQ